MVGRLIVIALSFPRKTSFLGASLLSVELDYRVIILLDPLSK